MNGKLYIQNEDDEYEELGTTKELTLEPIKIKKDAFAELIRRGWDIDNTFVIKPTYKKWYRKKKSKRYVLYSKTRYGINPKIFRVLVGGK